MKYFVSTRQKLLGLCHNFLERQGFSGVYKLGTWLGNLMWLVLPRRRTLAAKNIAGHLGMESCAAKACANQSFQHNARAFLELGLTRSFGLHCLDNGTLTMAQPELFERLLNCPRPSVAAAAHIGAWEFLSSVLGDLYPDPRPRVMVVRRYNDEVVQNYLTQCREAHGATIVGHRAVAASVLRALRQQGLVGFLVDHHALRSEAYMLPFLGQETSVNMGPALLAVRAEALVWPSFMLRNFNEAGPRYTLHLHEPLDTKLLEGSREEKVHQTALFYTQAVEKIVRQFPEQWFWMHNRWK